ncbi:MAG: flagellar hook-basal body complex protein FliE [Pseudomonadota bacterium]
MSNTISAGQLMMQMGQMKSQATSQQLLENNPLSLASSITTQSNNNSTPQVEKVNFSDLLSGVVNHVNNMQQQSGALRKDFEMGKEGVDLVEVMIASEKASVAFSALLETRNKLLKAYNQVKMIRV